MPQSDHRLSLASKVWYAVGYLPDSIMNNMYGMLILMVYNIELGLAAAAVGSVGTISRLVEAFIDPFFGNLSDNTKSRWGRRRPYMLAGCLLGGLLTLALWMPPAGLSHAALWWYLMVVAVLYYVAYAIYSVPFMALGLSLATEAKDRDSLMGWRVAANNLVLMVAPVVPILIYNKTMGSTPLESLSRIGIVLAACTIAAGVAATIFVTERAETPDVSKIKGDVAQDHHGLIDGFKCVVKNKPFLITTGIVSFTIIGLVVGTMFPFYMNLTTVFTEGTEDLRKEAASKVGAICGFASALLGLLYAPQVANVAAKFGRKPTLYLSLGTMIAAFLASPWLFTKQYPYLQVVFNIVIALGVTGIWVLTLPMLAEACDLDEIENGSRREGVFTAMYNWGIKVAIAACGLIGGILIDLSHFDAKLPVQTPDTISTLTMAFALSPVIFLAICIYLTWIFPLSPEKIRMMREQKERAEQP